VEEWRCSGIDVVGFKGIVRAGELARMLNSPR
jgi:hypothetical protein